MDFVHIVNDLPLWLSSLLFVGFAVLLVPGGQLAIRRRFGVDSLLVNNEVAGFKYAVLGVVYAVLLVFISVVVWEEFRGAKSNVEEEARAISDLNRLSAVLAEGDRARLQDSLLEYSRIVVDQEWPAMARRGASPAAEAALSRVFDAALIITMSENLPESIRETALELTIAITDSRRQRLDSADGAIPDVLWVVILIGGTTTLFFTWFFGSRNANAQAAMTAMLSLTIVMVIYVSALLDRPFTGSLGVSPMVLEHTIKALERPLALRIIPPG
jgi:hypothetical protein